MGFLCNAETKTARTKTALNLLGLAPWKNTHLLGTSNLIIFLLGARHAVQSGWSKKSMTTNKSLKSICFSEYIEWRTDGRQMWAGRRIARLTVSRSVISSDLSDPTIGSNSANSWNHRIHILQRIHAPTGARMKNLAFGYTGIPCLNEKSCL